MWSSLTLLPLALAATAAAQSYDYIIAGAGAAGLVVADRLAETGKSVLVVDRGAPSTYSSGGQWLTSFNDTLTWHDVPGLGLSIYSQYPNDPMGSPFCSDTADTAGCTLGGGTEINMMAFVLPPDSDFENWPAGWNGGDLGQARSMLHARNPGTLTPSADGKLYDQGAFKYAKKLLQNVGGWTQVNMLTDYNAKTNTFSHSAVNAIGGQRAGPVRTYLPYAQKKKNFHMMLQTDVVQVDRDGSKVTGMTISKNGQQSKVTLSGSGKAILAAGTMSTPRILWYSGIGQTDQLTAIQNSGLGVTLPPQSSWINLPVGHSLRNHASARLNLKTGGNLVFHPGNEFVTPSNKHANQYNQHGSGILAQTNERMHFWTSNTLSGQSHKRFYQCISLPEDTNLVQLQCVLSHGATSTGILGLDTSSGATTFAQSPIMQTAGDRAAFGKFLNMLIGYTKKAGSGLAYHGKNGLDLAKSAGLGKHYVGTCKMGTDDGRQGGTAVVDPNTKVYGTDNLFVVDGSMHPDLPTGNTMAIIMLAAEQAAMKIKALD